ncbi:ankyrin repeat domain-containing protein [Kistimonas asteriae]|uniref:ankyrin repeat domain-containing protein n=1 Tax=Kistimonas asteriae TaxID=517724 RepID=UPI001BAE1511|nr:ankyrin repeat domain-containing protein [Kistimonas asteriae]
MDNPPVNLPERGDEYELSSTTNANANANANACEDRPANISLFHRFTTLCCSCFLNSPSSTETPQMIPDGASNFSACFQEIDECGHNTEAIAAKISDLLSKNKDLNLLTNHRNNNLIMEFIECGNHSAAMTLINTLISRKWTETLNYSALIQSNIQNDTALTLALKNFRHGCEESIGTLLATNFLAQLEIPDDNNDTPLMLAIKRGDIAIIIQILEKANYGAQLFQDFNQDGFTALMLAVTLGQMDIVNLILASPAFTLTLFQQVNPKNETALTLATHSPSIRESLLDYQRDPKNQANMPTINMLDPIARLNTNISEWSIPRHEEHVLTSDRDVPAPPSIGPSASMLGVGGSIHSTEASVTYNANNCSPASAQEEIM